MTLYAHKLAGCAPVPLAHYLKALGILRLLGKQGDEHARAFWRDDDFVLFTSLSRDALMTFFLRDYAPTPMLTPWNGGSGFYPKDRKIGIDAIGASTLDRFEVYRSSIESARALVAGREESPKNEEKAELLKACKASWSGAALEWVNAATVVTQASEIAYPALLGSGGNDGRLDFANNFMQRLVELLPTTDGQPCPPLSAPLLNQSLFGAPIRKLSGAAIGQFLPGAAGGVNASAGFSGGALVNPWDFVLMLEGAMVLQVASVRRLDATGGFALPQASAPFAVRSRAAGYASAAPSDESARGEQWFPLWSRAATLPEVQALFVEGRLQAGKRRAGEPLQVARAIASLGIARGVSSFQRYAYAERNGQANLAVPLGRWQVGSKPRREAQLVEEIEDWIGRLRRAGAQQAAFDRHARRLEDLTLTVCQQSEGNAAMHLERLLEALGSAEAELVRRPRATAVAQLQPLPRLTDGWLELVGEGTLEFRLARAIATQQDARDQPSLRSNLAPLDGVRFRITQDALARDADVVWKDRDLIEDLGAVVLRRLTTLNRADRFPLMPGIPAALDDVVEFLEGRVDERRVARLTRALLAVSRGTPDPEPDAGFLTYQELRLNVSAAYALFRVLHSPWNLEESQGAWGEVPLFPSLKPRTDRSVLRHLLAGRIDAAASRAIQLLRYGGARPRMRHFLGSAKLGRRIVASLAIPVSRRDTNRLGALIFKPELVGEAHKNAPPAPSQSPLS